MTTRDDVTEFGFFGSNRHDTEPCHPPDGCGELTSDWEEDYTLSLEESARIVSECRAAGGSGRDAWEALKAAKRGAEAAAKALREAAFCSHADAGNTVRPWAPCWRTATTTRVREFVPGFPVVVPVCAEHAAVKP